MSAELGKDCSLSDYIKRHDPKKLCWMPLWETGSIKVRPSTATFDPQATSRLGTCDASGVWTTNSNECEVEMVCVSLPAPHDNGINLDTFGQLQANVIIRHVENKHTWLKVSGGKAKVVANAKKHPGVAVWYDAGNGYWRSSIWPLVRDFLAFKTTGVDARANRTKRASPQVSQEEEHVYEEKEDTNEEIPLGQPVLVDDAPLHDDAANGLLNWQLKAPAVKAPAVKAPAVKAPAVLENYFGAPSKRNKTDESNVVPVAGVFGGKDKLQSFLDEHCVWEETAPVRQWLGVKEMLATYNAEMGTTLKEMDFKYDLKSHGATSADYKEKGQAILSDVPLCRNTANGLLNWRLKVVGTPSKRKKEREVAEEREAAEGKDKLQSFLDEHCVWEETAPVRQWLGVKEMLATYNAEMGTTLKEMDFKYDLRWHGATSADYKEKGQAILSHVPLCRNTANGLLNWRLKAVGSPSKRKKTDESNVVPVASVVVQAVGVPIAQRPNRPVRGKDWLTPIDTHQQTMLYCGHIQDLWRYLKQYDLHKHNNPATWKAIREWTYTESGRKWLALAGMTPDGITLDHIHCKADGIIDHPYNCFLMPGSANSHFKDKWSEEKAQYIGELATRTSFRFVKWYIDESKKYKIDCSKFTGAGL